jgi:hypothetical protein
MIMIHCCQDPLPHSTHTTRYVLLYNPPPCLSIPVSHSVDESEQLVPSWLITTYYVVRLRPSIPVTGTPCGNRAPADYIVLPLKSVMSVSFAKANSTASLMLYCLKITRPIKILAFRNTTNRYNSTWTISIRVHSVLITSGLRKS